MYHRSTAPVFLSIKKRDADFFVSKFSSEIDRILDVKLRFCDIMDGK